MAKCKTCKHTNWCKDENGRRYNWCPVIDDCPDPEADRECDKHETMTNADRIRAMSYEELSEFLPITFDLICNPTEECMRVACYHGECVKTKECALKWLQSEVEEE